MMSSLLAGISTRIADRWIQAVVLSGLLWVATFAVAVRLGQTHPFDAERLSLWLDEVATQRVGHSPAAVLLAVAAALLAAGAAGLTAGGLGWLLQRLWAAEGARRPLSWLLRWRRKRGYDRTTDSTRRAVARAAVPDATSDHVNQARRALMRRTELKPHCCTRIGDAFHAVAVRLRIRYALDLEQAWPRLWTVLPETLRGDLSSARTAYDDAARLAGWGLLYVALAGFWWPAALIGVGVLTTAIARARLGAEVLATLVETAVDLHLAELVDQLSSRGTELGRSIDAHLNPPTTP
ncbi:hypothetical protein ABZT51_09320 [Streptomyces sp. NPDC005373]|uniref:hypothetical protein n=1 Tax=Streptomyces sp. NPDC005373 TaxID=3156879 RepID=UPI00339E1A15